MSDQVVVNEIAGDTIVVTDTQADVVTVVETDESLEVITVGTQGPAGPVGTSGGGDSDLPFLNAKEHGIAGDGITDDTVALQAFFDLLASSGEVGLFPASTYRLKPGIHVAAGVVARGVGPQTIFKLVDGYNVLDNVFKLENAPGAALSDFQLDGNRSALSSDDSISVNYGIYVSGSNEAVIDNLWVHHTSGVGIHIYNSTGVKVTRNESSYNRYHGFETEQTTNCVISSSNYGHHNDRHGIFVSPGEVGGTGSIGNEISENTFTYNGNYGIGFGIDAAGESIGLTRDNLVNDNVVMHNTFYGIDIYRVNGVSGTGNLIAYNGSIGLYLYRGEECNFQGNYFHNNSQTANGGADEILLEGASDGQASQHNIVSNNYILIDGSIKSNYGIREATGTDGPNTIKNNYIPFSGISGETLIQHPDSSYELISDDPGDNRLSLRTFDQGVSVAAGATLPGGTAGIDRPFGSAVTRMFDSVGNLQFVAPNGNGDWYFGGNNVFSVTSNYATLHGYPLKEVATGVDPTDAVNKAQLDEVADKSFQQSFTTVSSLTVNHKLGKYPSVTVIDSAGDEVEGDVIYVDLNTVDLAFSGAFSGAVNCN